MANFDDNPFAGDSENPFAVSICSVNRFLLRLMAPVCCNRAQYSEKQVIVLKIMLEMSCSFQDPSVASVTSNAARGLEDFNPFADQNTSQASGAKVVHFRTFLYFAFSSFCLWASLSFSIRGNSFLFGACGYCNIVLRFSL